MMSKEVTELLELTAELSTEELEEIVEELKEKQYLDSEEFNEKRIVRVPF